MVAARVILPQIDPGQRLVGIAGCLTDRLERFDTASGSGGSAGCQVGGRLEAELPQEGAPNLTGHESETVLKPAQIESHTGSR